MNVKFNLFHLILPLIIFYSCTEIQKKEYIKIQGKTMGTYFSISLQTKDTTDYAALIENTLLRVNNSLSTFIPTSTISKINRAVDTSRIDSLFLIVFNKAKEVHKNTLGAFDPTVMPLVNAWGFGFDTIPNMDTSMVDSLIKLTGLSNFKIENQLCKKHKKNAMLDFSAIAKGYGVDKIAEILENKGVENYLIEIGGEVRAKGKNVNNKLWRIGIEKPIEHKDQQRPLRAVIKLKDKAIATSGNYRNFYYKNNRKYAHTINPQTGYPVKHNLLSASVIAENCMEADAYATAFMVMGKDKATKLAEKMDLEVIFIFENENKELEEYVSESLKDKIEIVDNQKKEQKNERN